MAPDRRGEGNRMRGTCILLPAMFAIRGGWSFYV
jgi:hypothetical protein